MEFNKQHDSETLVHTSEGLVLSPDQGESLVRRWGYPFLIQIDKLNGGAKQFVVGSEKLLPGKSIHVHRHNNFEEILIIKSGRGTLLLGDKHVGVEPGSLIFIPQKLWHGLENTGTEVIDLLWIFPESGIESYFRETSVPSGQHPLALSEEEMYHIRTSHLESVEYRDDNLENYTAQKNLP